MRKLLLMTMLSLLTIACGKSGGGGGSSHDDNDFVDGGDTRRGEPYIIFVTDRPVTFCPQGSFTVKNGTRMSLRSAERYFGGIRRDNHIANSAPIADIYIQYPGQPYPRPVREELTPMQAIQMNY